MEKVDNLGAWLQPSDLCEVVHVCYPPFLKDSHSSCFTEMPVILIFSETKESIHYWNAPILLIFHCSGLKFYMTD